MLRRKYGRTRRSKAEIEFDRAHGRARTASLEAWDAVERQDKNARRYHEMARDAALRAAVLGDALGPKYAFLVEPLRESAATHAAELEK